MSEFCLPDPDKTVLIAGPTASGKSALALQIAQEQGGVIVNADAIQVYENWRVLTARPDDHDLSLADHRLYGHVPYATEYSVGHWLREVEQLYKTEDRLIIIGGTGLYFKALIEGLADIPATSAKLRSQSEALLEKEGLDALLADLDSATKETIDINNPRRVQRAWEVLQETGRSILEWHAMTPPPLLPQGSFEAIVLEADVDWLNTRIDTRFDMMIEAGALDEARHNLVIWDPTLPSHQAIGAPELIAYLRGELELSEARDLATIATHQFAKRQRTWFRKRMGGWRKFNPALREFVN